MTSSISTLIKKLELIENRTNIFEDADSVINAIAAAIRNGRSVRETAIAKGIGDKDQQLQKVAGTIAAIWNAIRANARRSSGNLNPAKTTTLLKTMEPRPQDGPTATVIDTFAPAGDDTKEKWVSVLRSYENALASNNQQQLASIQSQLAKFFYKMSTELRAMYAQQQQQTTNTTAANTPNTNNVSLDFT